MEKRQSRGRIRLRPKMGLNEAIEADLKERAEAIDYGFSFLFLTEDFVPL